MGNINNYHSNIGRQAMYNRSTASPEPDLEGLSEQLEDLLAEMRKRAGGDSSHLQEIVAVKAAIESAKESNRGGVEKALLMAGRWARSVAADMGVMLVLRAMGALDDTAP